MDESNMMQHANRAAAIGQCKSSLHEGKALKIRVLSGSMVPAIMPNDLIKVVSCNHKTLMVEDLVLAIVGDELMPRRIISKDKGEGNQESFLFTLKGDGLKEADPPVSNKGILGKIVQVERGGQTRVVKKGKILEKKASGLLDKIFFWKKD